MNITIKIIIFFTVVINAADKIDKNAEITLESGYKIGTSFNYISENFSYGNDNKLTNIINLFEKGITNQDKINIQLMKDNNEKYKIFIELTEQNIKIDNEITINNELHVLVDNYDKIKEDTLASIKETDEITLKSIQQESLESKAKHSDNVSSIVKTKKRNNQKRKHIRKLQKKIILLEKKVFFLNSLYKFTSKSINNNIFSEYDKIKIELEQYENLHLLIQKNYQPQCDSYEEVIAQIEILSESLDSLTQQNIEYEIYLNYYNSNSIEIQITKAMKIKEDAKKYFYKYEFLKFVFNFYNPEHTILLYNHLDNCYNKLDYEIDRLKDEELFETYRKENITEDINKIEKEIEKVRFIYKELPPKPIYNNFESIEQRNEISPSAAERKTTKIAVLQIKKQLETMESEVVEEMEKEFAIMSAFLVFSGIMSGCLVRFL